MNETSSEQLYEDTVEAGIKIKVSKLNLSPKRNVAYYFKEMCKNRAIVATALSAFISSGKSVFTPVRVLDGNAGSGVAGLIWKKYFGDKIKVTINDQKSSQIILENSKTNEVDVIVSAKDLCVLLHEEPYNFIYLDCHTDASLYFDSVFRNITKKGIFCISTKDDCAQFGQTPEAALRHYSAVIAKTSMAKELAVRVILADMARVAAKHNKGFRVLCVVSVKSSFTIIVEIFKGPAQATICVNSVTQLLHCNMCEDHAFYPNSVFASEAPNKMLKCNCHQSTPGKTLMCLGPMWCKSLFDHSFIKELMNHSKQFPWEPQIKDLLGQIFIEAWCPLLGEETVLKYISSTGEELRKEKTDEDTEIVAKKRKLSDTELIADNSSKMEPSFYFNVHKYSPKGSNMIGVEKVIMSLRKAGFRASRTHFDPLAIRTNAPLSVFKTVIGDNP